MSLVIPSLIGMSLQTGAAVVTPNLLASPNDFSTSSWAKDGVGITSDGTTAPNGVAAFLMTMPSVQGGNRVTQGASVVFPAGTYQISITAKAAITSKLRVSIDFASPNAAITFDLSAPSAGMTDLGGGWFLLAFTSVQTAATIPSIQYGWPGVSGKAAGWSVYISQARFALA